MTPRKFISLIAILALSALSACGGGNGGGADPNAPANVSLESPRTVALANSGSVTVNAIVTKADGAPVADGTVVAFSIAGSPGATLSASEASSVGGIASVALTHSSISVTNVSVVVTATAGGKSGNLSVKFISQPTSVDVSIRFGVEVTNLAALQFQMNNTAGATFDNNTQLISRVNSAAEGSNSILQAGFNSVTNSLTVGLANSTGFNTGTTPIITVKYAIAAGSGLPTFSVATTGFTAADPLGNATVPPVTASNLIVTTVFNTE